jgi:2-methylisocitrate lyase-like PEP mutase family enzyme
MTTDTAQHERAVRFADLHTGDQPLLLTNAWDATSARVLAAAGASAIGTTSFGVALSNGVWDGELLPLEAALDIARAIASAVDVPVSVDLEAGRGAGPDEVKESVTRVISGGAVGINLEDSIPGKPGVLFGLADQAARITAARAAAAASGVPLFINARCDVYFGAKIAADEQVSEVLARARAYQEAGADGLFLPGLLDLPVIASITSQTSLPLNVMTGDNMPSVSDLAAAGVRRVSQGGASFLGALGWLKTLTEHYLAGQLSPPSAEVGAGASLLRALVS